MQVQSISVARILIGGAQTTNHMQWRHQKILKEELYVVPRYRRMEDRKPWPGLALTRILLKEAGLNLTLKSENV